MFNFLKKLISPAYYEGGLGALENPTDPRDVQASAFQPDRKLPAKYITDISILPRYDQLKNGSCVGHAITLAIAYYEYKEAGSLAKLSPRFIYGLAKRVDGLVSEGTYPRVGGAVALNNGCATENTLPNSSYLPHGEYVAFEVDKVMEADAYPRKIGGYAFVNTNAEDLKTAIVNNGVVCVSLSVGSWSRSPVKPGTRGRHYVLVYGYDGDKFYFANSWGFVWGNEGNGYFRWVDHKDTIRDIMVITDIPNKILKEAKAQWKYKHFKPTEKTGSMGTCADLDPKLLDYVDKLREVVGVPFKPTSGFRTIEQNNRVGGAKNSAHLRRLAVDILCTTKVMRDKIKAGIRKLDKEFGMRCFTEYANSHIHIDVDPSIHKLGTFIIVDEE